MIHSPGPSAPIEYAPIDTRIKRNVGNPTAAVIFLTWRLRPSVIVISNQDVGIDFLYRIGG